MKNSLAKYFSFLFIGLLVGCGGGGSGANFSQSTIRGTLVANPPFRVASLNATDLTTQFNNSITGSALLKLTGTPACGVDFYYINYWTVGAQNEAASATGVMMIPTAPSNASPAILKQCTGPHSLLLYAHGTNTQKNFNLAAVNDPTNPATAENGLLTAFYAAQGYIVVAPNYAGYDTSSLPYHPYLNADQQSKDMIDMLTASRTALNSTLNGPIQDNGKLFVTGYSQGGLVAMATHRALEQLHMTVTASAPMSGPYALEAFGDTVFLGAVDIGSTVFTPLLVNSYQHEYGNIFHSPSDIFTSTYANQIVSLLPNIAPLNSLFQSNQLPSLALFNGTAPVIPGNTALNTLFQATTPATTPASAAPIFALGFSTLSNPDHLVTNAYRVNYVTDLLTHPDGAIIIPGFLTGTTAEGIASAPQNTLRQAFNKNDMRQPGWAPIAPIQLCGGLNDPTVFFTNTQIILTYWSQLATPPTKVTFIDVDPGGNTPANLYQTIFVGSELGIPPTTIPQIYHTELVPPVCMFASRNFFNTF
jgi:hypothetical protein